MQPPYPPMMNTGPQVPSPRRKSPFKIAALGCGLPLLGLLVLGALFGDGNSKAPKGGAGSSEPGQAASYSSAAFQKYTGKWTGSDGTSMWIRGDGKGDFDGGSLKVSGGGVTLDEKAKTLAITSFFNMGKTWKITTPSDGSRMALDGITYRRTDGGAANASTSTSGAVAGQAPGKSEQQRLVKETLTQFDGALASGDFTNLYSYSAKAWQAETSPDEMKGIFKSFLDQKIRLNDVLKKSKMVLTGEPDFGEHDLMTLHGYYPAGSKRLNFDLGYVPEDGQWKLGSLHVKAGNAP